MIQQQLAAVYQKINSISKSHQTYPGLTCFGEDSTTFIDVGDIPGVKEVISSILVKYFCY
jgi:hypothetical protein